MNIFRMMVWSQKPSDFLHRCYIFFVILINKSLVVKEIKTNVHTHAGIVPKRKNMVRKSCIRYTYKNSASKLLHTTIAQYF